MPIRNMNIEVASGEMQDDIGAQVDRNCNRGHHC